jgi:hypothetical protein
MSQADLLEFNDVLVDIAREHANVVLIFAPPADLPLIARHLSDLTSDYGIVCLVPLVCYVFINLFIARLLAKEKTQPSRSPFAFVQAALSDAALGDVPLTVFNLA